MLIGIAEQWTKLIKMEVTQDPFKLVVRLKWTLHEISYLFACELLGQDKHNKQTLML